MNNHAEIINQSWPWIFPEQNEKTNSLHAQTCISDFILMLCLSTWHQHDYIMAHYVFSLKLKPIFLGFHFKWYIFMQTCQYLWDIPAGVQYGWCVACRSNKFRFSEIRAKKKRRTKREWWCECVTPSLETLLTSCQVGEKRALDAGSAGGERSTTATCEVWYWHLCCWAVVIIWPPFIPDFAAHVYLTANLFLIHYSVISCSVFSPLVCFLLNLFLVEPLSLVLFERVDDLKSPNLKKKNTIIFDFFLRILTLDSKSELFTLFMERILMWINSASQKLFCDYFPIPTT